MGKIATPEEYNRRLQVAAIAAAFLRNAGGLMTKAEAMQIAESYYAKGLKLDPVSLTLVQR